MHRKPTPSLSYWSENWGPLQSAGRSVGEVSCGGELGFRWVWLGGNIGLWLQDITGDIWDISV